MRHAPRREQKPAAKYLLKRPEDETWLHRYQRSSVSWMAGMEDWIILEIDADQTPPVGSVPIARFHKMLSKLAPDPATLP